MSGRFVDRNFPVSRYRSEDGGLSAEIDAKVFGAGFVSISSWRDDRAKGTSNIRTVLIDPGDIERLEEALKEAKRRRNGHMRRLRKKIDREYETGERSYAGTT